MEKDITPSPVPARSEYSDEQKDALKVLVIEIGVTATSNRLKIPRTTLQSWVDRYGWLRDIPKHLLPKRRRNKMPMKPSDALVQEFKELDGDSRINLARGLNKGAKAIGKMQGIEVVERATEVKSVVQSIALTHAWDSTRPVNKVSLSITGNGKAIEGAIDAEWSEIGESNLLED
jgi:hypothetical protein